MNVHDQRSDKTRGTARVPESVLKAISEIVSFYWNDEFSHYSALSREERKGERHIFQDLTRVRRWLRQRYDSKRINKDA